MRYTPITAYADHLFPDYLFGLQSLWPWEWGATALIGAALIGGIVGRRSSTFVLIAITALCGLTFRFWEDIQSTTVWNLRFLPFWYLGIFLLMGMGGAELVRGAAWAARRGAREWATRTPPRIIGLAVAVVLTVVLSMGALISIDDGKSFIPYWTRWNYRGYQDTTGEGSTPAKQWTEYHAFVSAFDGLPSGRVLWEGNTQLNVYGSPLAPMLLPYWTHGRISSMEGVYYEASATTPYHFMATAALDAPGNSSGAVRGITYRSQADFALGRPLVAGARRAVPRRPLRAGEAEGGCRPPADACVATSPDVDGVAPNGWSIYARAGHRARRTAEVPAGRRRTASTSAIRRACRERLIQTGVDEKSLHLHEWQDCIGVPWFDDEAALDRPLVDEGPASWQHAGTSTARARRKERLPHVRVTDIRTDDDSISFHVSRTGVPVMVKASWYPNWEADGAHGPYRATPNYMVVVPTRARRHPALRDDARGVARSPGNARRLRRGRAPRVVADPPAPPDARRGSGRRRIGPNPDARPRQHLQGVRRPRRLSRRDRRVGCPRRRAMRSSRSPAPRASSSAGTLDHRVRRSSPRSPRERRPPGPTSSTSGLPRPTWSTSRRAISTRPAPCSRRVTIPRSTRASSSAAPVRRRSARTPGSARSRPPSRRVCSTRPTRRARRAA